MPSTLAGQFTIVSLALGILVILLRAKRAYDKNTAEEAQHRAWLEELWLEKCRNDGTPVSEELIKKHMKINGNSKLSSAEKDRIYGPNRPKSHDSDELMRDEKGNVRSTKK